MNQSERKQEKRAGKLITIVVAEDHQLLRHALLDLLEAQPGFVIVGEAEDDWEAIDLVERLHPDVLLLDLTMHGSNGLEVIRRARERSPLTQVVILSTYADEAYVVESLRAGAKAYVLKESSFEELLRAIGEAAVGRQYISLPLSEPAVVPA